MQRAMIKVKCNQNVINLWTQQKTVTVILVENLSIHVQTTNRVSTYKGLWNINDL